MVLENSSSGICVDILSQFINDISQSTFWNFIWFGFFQRLIKDLQIRKQ